MKRLGRSAWLAAPAAFSVLTVVACSSGAIYCGPCLGNFLDPNGLIGPQDRVASIRVCIDSACRTTQYDLLEHSRGRYADIFVSLPNTDRVESIGITTFDAQDRVVRVETATSIDLPTVKRTRKNSCACSGLKIAYDNQGGRFVVTTQ